MQGFMKHPIYPNPLKEKHDNSNNKERQSNVFRRLRPLKQY